MYGEVVPKQTVTIQLTSISVENGASFSAACLDFERLGHLYEAVLAIISISLSCVMRSATLLQCVSSLISILS